MTNHASEAESGTVDIGEKMKDGIGGGLVGPIIIEIGVRAVTIKREAGIIAIMIAADKKVSTWILEQSLKSNKAKTNK